MVAFSLYCTHFSLSVRNNKELRDLLLMTLNIFIFVLTPMRSVMNLNIHVHLQCTLFVFHDKWIHIYHLSICVSFETKVRFVERQQVLLLLAHCCRTLILWTSTVNECRFCLLLLVLLRAHGILF